MKHEDTKKIMIAPSLLAADFSCLEKEVQKVASADFLHLDIMDGIFVPNISFGFPILNALKDKTELPFDVHLMIEHPSRYIKDFAKSGAEILTFHLECEDDAGGLISTIRKSGMRPGLAIKPNTDVTLLKPFLRELYMVTIMTVEPGFGGQELMRDQLDKVAYIKEIAPTVLVELDGGINLTNLTECIKTGADVLVAGTSVFKAQDPYQAISQMRGDYLSF